MVSEAAHFGLSGQEVKGVADDHFGVFRAWIPERSDFLRGPKAPWAWSEATFLRGPKATWAPRWLAKFDTLRNPWALPLVACCGQLWPGMAGQGLRNPHASSALVHARVLHKGATETLRYTITNMSSSA